MTDKPISNEEPNDEVKESCVGQLSRAEFIKRVLLVSSLGAAPVLVDKFLVPPAYARHSIQKRTPPTMQPDAPV